MGCARRSLGGKVAAGLEIINLDVLYVLESRRADTALRCVWEKAVMAFGGDGGVCIESEIDLGEL